jgi:hypothetical protein
MSRGVVAVMGGCIGNKDILSGKERGRTDGNEEGRMDGRWGGDSQLAPAVKFVQKKQPSLCKDVRVYSGSSVRVRIYKKKEEKKEGKRRRKKEFR